MRGPPTQLFKDSLLCLLADLRILQLNLEKGRQALNKLEHCLVSDAAAIFKINALQAVHVLANHI